MDENKINLENTCIHNFKLLEGNYGISVPQPDYIEDWTFAVTCVFKIILEKR